MSTNIKGERLNILLLVIGAILMLALQGIVAGYQKVPESFKLDGCKTEWVPILSWDSANWSINSHSWLCK